MRELVWFEHYSVIYHMPASCDADLRRLQLWYNQQERVCADKEPKSRQIFNSNPHNQWFLKRIRDHLILFMTCVEL